MATKRDETVILGLTEDEYAVTLAALRIYAIQQADMARNGVFETPEQRRRVIDKRNISEGILTELLCERF